jgi:hypothetical protein
VPWHLLPPALNAARDPERNARAANEIAGVWSFHFTSRGRAADLRAQVDLQRVWLQLMAAAWQI